MFYYIFKHFKFQSISKTWICINAFLFYFFLYLLNQIIKIIFKRKNPINMKKVMSHVYDLWKNEKINKY